MKKSSHRVNKKVGLYVYTGERGFFPKNLANDTVIICGTLTDFCCGTTSTDDPARQEPELRVLRKGFAKVLSLDEFMELLP